MFLPKQEKRSLIFFFTHYQYLEETRPIRHKALVILIPCNNCNEHKVDPENCEFILDSENHIFGFSFKLTDRKSETYYIVKKQVLRKYEKHLV